jgi:hypothetical protein
MLEPDGQLDRRRDPAGDFDGVPSVGQHGQQHHELIPAESGHAVHRAYGMLEPGGDLAQDHITGGVAADVVDLLEPIEVDEDQADGGGRSLN